MHSIKNFVNISNLFLKKVFFQNKKGFYWILNNQTYDISLKVGVFNYKDEKKFKVLKQDFILLEDNLDLSPLSLKIILREKKQLIINFCKFNMNLKNFDFLRKYCNKCKKIMFIFEKEVHSSQIIRSFQFLSAKYKISFKEYPLYFWNEYHES